MPLFRALHYLGCHYKGPPTTAVFRSEKPLTTRNMWFPDRSQIRMFPRYRIELNWINVHKLNIIFYSKVSYEYTYVPTG